MPEQNKPFVVTDRRKFTMDGDLRPDADPSPAREPRPETLTQNTPQTSAAIDDIPAAGPTPVPSFHADAESPAGADASGAISDDQIPAGPTAEHSEQARLAYEATAERLDTAIRAANPGMDHPPTMSFEQLVQSVYMSAVMQLGGGTPEGQQPQVDIIGARQSIDMLNVLQQKTSGNLATDERRLLESALFELRMAFLEITQALSRSAKAAQPAAPGQPGPRGPSIVR